MKDKGPRTKTTLPPVASLLTFAMAPGAPVPYATAVVGHDTGYGFPVLKTYRSGARTITMVPPDLLFAATVGYATSSASLGVALTYGRAA